LPVDLCEDRVTLPCRTEPTPPQESPIAGRQRWNDYGIACLLEGGVTGKRAISDRPRRRFGDCSRRPADAARTHTPTWHASTEEGRLSEAGRS
jgi:hypothetical protein